MYAKVQLCAAVGFDGVLVEVEKITSSLSSETSEVIRKRVADVQVLQQARFAEFSFVFNSEMGSCEIENFCNMESAAVSVLKDVTCALSFLARFYHKTIKVAQTMADLDHSQTILREHALEALQYRPKID